MFQIRKNVLFKSVNDSQNYHKRNVGHRFFIKNW